MTGTAEAIITSRASVLHSLTPFTLFRILTSTCKSPRIAGATDASHQVIQFHE